MQKKCKGNYGRHLSEAVRKVAAGSDQTAFNVTIGQVYQICGMLLTSDGILKYLTLNDYKSPVWLPSELFEPSSDKLPASWYFADHPDFNVCIWGYKRLVQDLDHFDGLIDGNEQDEVHFFKEFESLRQSIDSGNDDFGGWGE